MNILYPRIRFLGFYLFIIRPITSPFSIGVYLFLTNLVHYLLFIIDSLSDISILCKINVPLVLLSVT